MFQHSQLITMVTRFDLGRGVELVRLPQVCSSETAPRWYITRANEYILHRREGWMPYTSVADGDFLFPDPDSAFAHFLKTGYGVFEDSWVEATGTEFCREPSSEA